jgi:hypothetical protein
MLERENDSGPIDRQHVGSEARVTGRIEELVEASVDDPSLGEAVADPGDEERIRAHWNVLTARFARPSPTGCRE